MYIPIAIKTDYTLLSSLIKIKDLMAFAKENNITTLGILDDNLCGVMDFYDNAIMNNIKPVIGLYCMLNNNPIYLYAKDYLGYQSLLKINTIINKQDITLQDLEKHKINIKCLIPYESINLYKELKEVYNNIYVGYKNDFEKRNSLIVTSNVVFVNVMLALNSDDCNYLKYLYKMNDKSVGDVKYSYYLDDVLEDDINSVLEFVKDINIVIDKSNRYIPVFDKNKNSRDYLYTLINKGLQKRLNGVVTEEYQNRLNYEFDVISKMGYIDYFLIVYDYVKYAKTHDILVGPGRGSAAGSLVSYCLGITNVDPIKYNLLFERFLNPERVSMPDIDIDFEDVKREDIINYVREKYGVNCVAPIMTYNTLTSKQVLKDVSKIIDGDVFLIDNLLKDIDSKLSLRDNLKNKIIYDKVKNSKELGSIYKISLKLEGIKRHVSTHAAGVVICDQDLDNIIPVIYNGDNINTGITMNYLEELGLLKMDFLAIANLTIVHNILKLVDNEVDLNKIDLNIPKIYEMFSKGETEGIFQYESSGMKNFLIKLGPTCFSDLIAAVALFRPGPMDNIDLFIERKKGIKKVTYLDKVLEPILCDTYGIIVYQEQIMQILVTMGGYSFAQADNIRRAMSKKKLSVINEDRVIFIKNAVARGYNEEVCNNVYDLIIKFANYGFNKAHSVSYALFGYQMAYLKTFYPVYFIANLLNMSIGSDVKTKEYLDEAKRNNIFILKVDINLSNKDYKVGKDKIRLPLSIIKGIGSISVNAIIDERNNGDYLDFFDFVLRTYNLGINKKIIESLINASVFSSFNVNNQTLINNIDNAIRYAELAHDLDLSLVEKPTLELFDEYSDFELMNRELSSYGFYVTNHPSSKFNTKDIMKISKIREYFNKYVKCVVIISNVRKIKTKKQEDMAFISGNDETGSIDFILFPSNIILLKGINVGDLVMINGLVARRLDKFQINIANIKKV